MTYTSHGPRDLLVPLFSVATIFAVAVGAMLFAIDTMQPALATSAVLDLLVTGPVVFLLFIYLRKLPLLAIVPVTFVGFNLATFVAPETMLSQIAQAKWVVFPVLGCVAVRAGYLAIRSLREVYPRFSAIPDSRDRLRAVLTSRLGAVRATDIILSDVSFLRYAFFPPVDNDRGPGAFSSHRRSGLVPLLWAIVGVVVLETVVLHILVHLVSPLLALILSGLSLYSLLSLIGHIRALPRRYTTLGETHVTIRVGLFGQCEVPYNQIASISQISAASQTPPDAWRLGMLGAVEPYNLLLTLHSACNVDITHGITRKTRHLVVNMDDPQAFSAAILGMRDRVKLES